MPAPQTAHLPAPAVPEESVLPVILVILAAGVSINVYLTARVHVRDI